MHVHEQLVLVAVVGQVHKEDAAQEELAELRVRARLGRAEDGGEAAAEEGQRLGPREQLEAVRLAEHGLDALGEEGLVVVVLDNVVVDVAVRRVHQRLRKVVKKKERPRA